MLLLLFYIVYINSNIIIIIIIIIVTIIISIIWDNMNICILIIGINNYSANGFVQKWLLFYYYFIIFSNINWIVIINAIIIIV